MVLVFCIEDLSEFWTLIDGLLNEDRTLGHPLLMSDMTLQMLHGRTSPRLVHACHTAVGIEAELCCVLHR